MRYIAAEWFPYSCYNYYKGAMKCDITAGKQQWIIRAAAMYLIYSACLADTISARRGGKGQRSLLNMSRNKFARYAQEAAPGKWFSDDSVGKVTVGRRRTGWVRITEGRNVTKRKRTSDGRRRDRGRGLQIEGRVTRGTPVTLARVTHDRGVRGGKNR